MASGDAEIWVSSTSFQNINIGWRPTERVSDISKKWIFDDPFHKKGLVLIIWVLGMIQTSGSVIFLMKWGCWGHWVHWGCWGCRGLWGCKGSKVWKIITDYCRVIQVPEFNYILMFWNQIFLVRIMKYQVEFWNLFSLNDLYSLNNLSGLNDLNSLISSKKLLILMVRSSLAPKWSKPVPFCGMDNQKSSFLLISGTLCFGGCWGQPMLLFW